MADEASQRESWWVLQAQSGSHEALDELFKRVQEPLFRYIVSLVRDQHLAEDILQEVFIRIYRKLRWLREPEAFRYLNRERRWSDQIRDEATLTALPAGEHDGEFPREIIEKLPQLVDQLSPASRAVVVLFYLHELSLVETAAVLDIPVGTVKSRLAYGLASLRRSFERRE